MEVGVAMFESLAQRLTAHPNPSVRYLALIDFHHHDRQDPDVRAARTAIPDVAPVRAILEAQYPAGYWMHADLGVSPRYRATVWQVLFLAQFGVGPIEPVARAVSYLWDANCDAVGAFHLRKGNEGRSPALTAAMLWAFARLGLTAGPRLARSWSWLDERWEVGGLPASARVWILRASAVWGRGDWAARLAPEFTFEPCGPLMFPLIHRPDALARAEAWCEAHSLIDSDTVHSEGDCVRDALKAKFQRAPVAGWPLERLPGKMWLDPGPVGVPNPWVTLRVLRVLQCLDAE